LYFTLFEKHILCHKTIIFKNWAGPTDPFYYFLRIDPNGCFLREFPVQFFCSLISSGMISIKIVACQQSNKCISSNSSNNIIVMELMVEKEEKEIVIK